MIENSKALKDFERNYKKTGKLESWWLDCKLHSAIRDIRWFFVKPYRQLKKLIDWQRNVFKNDYDFDAHCLYAIIEYKLKRVYPILEEGHAIQTQQDIKALRLAIKLAGRLDEDRYNMVEWDRHAKKWGEMKNWFTPVDDGTGNSYWNSSRPNAVTPEEQEKERLEMLAGYVRASAAMKRDEARLYGILSKYLRRWWD